MPVLKLCSADLPPLTLVSLLVVSVVVSLSFGLPKFSVGLEGQVPYPLESCSHGSFVLGPVRLLLPFPLYGQQSHSSVELGTTLSLWKAYM